MKRNRSHITVDGTNYFYEWRSVSRKVYRIYWLGNEECKKVLFNHFHNSDVITNSVVLNEGKTYFDVCYLDEFYGLMKSIKL